MFTHLHPRLLCISTGEDNNRNLKNNVRMSVIFRIFDIKLRYAITRDWRLQAVVSAGCSTIIHTYALLTNTGGFFLHFLTSVYVYGAANLREVFSLNTTVFTLYFSSCFQVNHRDLKDINLYLKSYFYY